MTLLVTIATPDAIVMAADSALTHDVGGEIVTLAGFPKIVYNPPRHIGISFTGPAQVGGGWIHNWLAQFCDDVAVSNNPVEFAKELAETLNETPGAKDQLLALQLCSWVRIQETYLLPNVWEVSNPNGEDFSAKSLVIQEFVDDVAKWTKEKLPGTYPVRVHSSGIPKDYTSWITRMLPEYSKLIGAQVPFNNTGHISLLARFLVRQVSDLLAISGRPNVVAEPILTRILLPQPTYVISEYR